MIRFIIFLIDSFIHHSNGTTPQQSFYPNCCFMFPSPLFCIKDHVHRPYSSNDGKKIMKEIISLVNPYILKEWELWTESWKEFLALLVNLEPCFHIHDYSLRSKIRTSNRKLLDFANACANNMMGNKTLNY